MTTYDYRTLTTSINALATPPSLILDKIFTAKNQNYSSTLEIDIEKSADYKKLAPFTGSSQEGKVISKVGFSTKTVKFPRIRVKKQLSATEILAQRDIGESVYVGGDALKARQTAKLPVNKTTSKQSSRNALSGWRQMRLWVGLSMPTTSFLSA